MSGTVKYVVNVACIVFAIACGSGAGVAQAASSRLLATCGSAFCTRVEPQDFRLDSCGVAVYDQDRWRPQVAIGMQYKDNLDFDFVPALLGAREGQDIDWYLAATGMPGDRWSARPVARSSWRIGSP